MSRLGLFLVVFFLLPRALPASDARAPAAATELFNGRDLSGWTQHVKAGEPADASTWSVADGVIRCTGAPTGYLRSEGRYRNFRLTLEWRWVGPDLPPDAQGRARRRNSGVLFHADGSGAVWPASIEAQLMQTLAGDLYVLGSAETAEIAAARQQAAVDAGSDAGAIARARNIRRQPRIQANAEKPAGEWNTCEITCAGDTVVLRINGAEQNRATKLTVTEGHLALQAEGAPIEFRHVRIAPLE